ncbi:MAG: YfbK domain-containing protein [Verrucomicrobiota bacterium]
MLDEWGTVSQRHQAPEGGESQLIVAPLDGQSVEWKAASHSSRFATATALFGMLLRDSKFTGDASYATVRELALVGALDERQSELVALLGYVEE